jgi:hypothetical protein
MVSVLMIDELGYSGEGEGEGALHARGGASVGSGQPFAQGDAVVSVDPRVSKIVGHLAKEVQAEAANGAIFHREGGVGSGLGEWIKGVSVVDHSDD